MKDQFFCDENDYQKYGLLRILNSEFPGGVTVAWMLTHNDETRLSTSPYYRYFDKPEKWRHFDPELFDTLLGFVCTPGKFAKRGVQMARSIPGLEDVRFFDAVLPETLNERSAWFKGLKSLSKGTDVVFFDPDVGMQTDSCPITKKRSDAHLYWDELTQFYNDYGFTVLVYQHFPHRKHDESIDHKARQISDLLKAKRIISFKTSQMVMMLIPQQRHLENIEKILPVISDTWRGKIQVKIHNNS